MTTDAASLRSVAACQCYGDWECPPCQAFSAEPLPDEPEPENRPPRRLGVLRPVLVAAHAQIVASIEAGETYIAIARRYGVSEEALRWYLQRTEAFVPRTMLQRERMRNLAPHILAEYATGMTSAALAWKYGISPHTIWRIRRRAEAAQYNGKGKV